MPGAIEDGLLEAMDIGAAGQAPGEPREGVGWLNVDGGTAGGSAR